MPKGFKGNVAHEYDILGRMVQSEVPQKKKDGSIQYQKATTGYDTTGNVTEKEEQIDGDKTAKTEYTYDKQGNLVMVKSCQENNQAQYVYDIQGNKVRQFTGMTAPLTLTVSEVTDAAEGADTFSYAGKTYQLTVSGTKKTDTVAETKYEYDGKNQLVAYTDPEGRRETYTYDVNGNRIKTADKNGNTRKNTYGYQNRLTEMVATPSQKGQEKKTGKETKHTYTYNAYGDVATQDDTAFAYEDASGQVTKETTKLTKNKDVVKNYTYDSAGNKSAFAVKVGDDTKLSLQYTYDGESKLTAVTDEKGNKVVDYDYDIDGNLSERTVPGNNMTTTYTYDYQNHLMAMKNQTGSAGVISQYTSEYLANGQKSKETSDISDKEGRKAKKTASYTYDLLGRITKETKTGSEDISYTYDSNNNRKEMKVGNKITAYKYNKNDELLRTDTLNTDTEEDSVVIYKNDKNGNQLATVNRYEIPSEKKDKTYIDIDVTLGDNRLNENVVNHYNAENQLIQTLTKNYKVSFTYDAEGLRTSKTVNGEKTVFVWDGDQLVMGLSESGKVQKRYIRGNDLVYADKGDNTEKQYYVTDPHGNVVQLTDESGKVVKTYEYDSFGNEVKPDSKDDNPFRYCGEYYDKETEELYLRARYYQSEVGRFLTRDTYTGEEDEPLSLHLYTYCENDGVNAWDPSGYRKNIVRIGSKPSPTPGPTPTPRPTAKTNAGSKPIPGPGPEYVYNIKYGQQQRVKIQEYCQKYAEEPNPGFRYMSGDCANFVSQCLWYAGFKQTADWHYNRRLLLPDNATKAWAMARVQYEYFRRRKFCKEEIVVKIGEKSQMRKRTKLVKTGDLLYWANRDGGGNVTHATIIYSNKKEKGKKVLRYGGHTKPSKNKRVDEKFKKPDYRKIIILRLRDKVSIP